MILTQNQIEELLNIIDKNQIVAIGTNLGPDFLSEGDRDLLKEVGVDFEYLPELDPVFSQFNYGLLAEALGQTAFESLTYDQLKEYIRMGRYIPLTYIEEVAINTIKRQAFNDLKTLGGRIFKDVNQILINNTLSEQKQFLRDEISSGIADKKSVTEIAHTIAEKTGDWSRDFERIVAYNSHLAFESGKAAMIQKNNEGKDPTVYKQPFDQACDHCIRLFLTNGVGSQPRLFKLSELIANGTNIGVKTKDWKATVSPIHPYCFDDKTEVLTNNGFKFFKDLDKTESFLSINLDSGNSEWVKAVRWVDERYDGLMFQFKNKNFNLLTTPNHHHVIRTHANKKPRLVETNKLPTEAQFLKHIPSWEGIRPVYKFDDETFDEKLFSQFLGFYLSEGSCIDYKGRKTIHISQSPKKYLDEIYEICSSLFTSVSKCKDYVQIMAIKRPELWNWLSSFGKSNQKRVPTLVKESNQELIEQFLNSYCKGDGSFRKGRKWDGYQCKDSREYFTSSKLMADDLGELILKLGKCPSFKLKEPQTIFDPKRGKSYTQNQGIWLITELTNRFVYKTMLQCTQVHYCGKIYDVELEKNHTLIVRREGKVVVSGNCRCSLHHLPDNAVWDDKKKQFVEDIPYAPLRKQFRIWIDGQERLV